MNSHVSAILLGVKDMERSKRFYTDLGWKVEHDYTISVFFVPHGGSKVGFHSRDGLAEPESYVVPAPLGSSCELQRRRESKMNPFNALVSATALPCSIAGGTFCASQVRV